MKIFVALVLPMLLFAASARADETAFRRVEVGASLGYAAPVGSAERGSRTSDTNIGLVPIELDLAYRINPAFGVVASARYGIGIPTLCKTAGDCTSSLGSDVVLALRARIFLPRLWRMSPFADVGIGYEWLTTRLTDAGVTSTRAYPGPLPLSMEVAAPFRLSPR